MQETAEKSKNSGSRIGTTSPAHAPSEMRETMNEAAIRKRAHERNDKGRDPIAPGQDKYRIGGDLFRDRIASHIDHIPLNPARLAFCPACESVACGVCGKCHELDRQSFRTGPTCPCARHLYSGDHQSNLCRAWLYALTFVRDAIKQEDRA